MSAEKKSLEMSSLQSTPSSSSLPPYSEVPPKTQPPSLSLSTPFTASLSHSSSSDELPAPATSPTPPSPLPLTYNPAKPTPTAQKYALTPTTIIPIWIVLSSGVIIYNNYLYNTLNFRYPVFLVTFHLTFAAVGTRVLKRFTGLLKGVDKLEENGEMRIGGRLWVRRILPIGVLFSASLILSNSAYLYLSVAYIQMLKAFVPVAILLITWSFRLSEPNRKLALIVLMISGGVALASQGERKFNLVGFLIQAGAVGFEASRLVLIQTLLHNLKMDPLVSLYYYAPVCAVINLVGVGVWEGLAPLYDAPRIGALVLLSNAALAFLLNVAAVFLVGVGSGLVLTLAGVFKDILLISGSVLIFGSMISPIQVFGYSMALMGLVLFKTSGGK